jgi:hypothetical protein
LLGSSPARKNSHGRIGNLTRDLMVSSEKLWPPSHETEQVGIGVHIRYYRKRNVVALTRYCDMCVLTHNLKYYLQLAN